MANCGNTVKRFVATALLLLLSSCAGKIPTEELHLHAVGYDDLSGWTNDHQAEAIPALQKSCSVIGKKDPSSSLGLAGTAHDWANICTALKTTPPASDIEARRFIENHFQPYAVEGHGLFTGYYEATLNGAWQADATYKVPLWQRPDDLIAVDLGDFTQELKGKKIAGKIIGHNLKPYDDRAAIARGSLFGRAEPLIWVDDPIAAFFLEIQGSGRIQMPDDVVMHVGYDAQNGHDYVPIGRVLAARNDIEKPVTMEKIRAWLLAHPKQAQDIMNQNPSVVFFRRVDSEGAIGAEGVALTPKRSMAVDTHFIPFGVPLWMEAEGVSGNEPMRRLMVAQDTGGAIKGAVRGDMFWGAGAKAEAMAGVMQSNGTYYVLLPKSVNVRE